MKAEWPLSDETMLKELEAIYNQVEEIRNRLIKLIMSQTVKTEIKDV